MRSTFFIDDKNILRAMVYYPMSNGRSVKELLRLLTAMQTSDRNGIVTPEGWQVGDQVIVPPPTTTAELKNRSLEGHEYIDWYFSRTDL